MEAGHPRSLEGLRVIDAATLFAGPMSASILGDFGADVIKVEHPRGDPLRNLGSERDGVPLWWSVASRNKRCVTIDLSKAGGQHVLRRLVATADVFIENFRPGTLERWDLAPSALHELNPGLVILRTTLFGQTGPYSRRPGFGTFAEAMSGYAHINGWPDGPPTLPPFALGDGVSALYGTFGVMFALWWREHGGDGAGQVIDLSILESLFNILGPHATLYDQLGHVQGRSGNAAPFTAPRNAYRSSDGKWLALSASTQSVADRIMVAIGRPDIRDQDWYRTNAGRLQHVDEIDEVIAAWVAARNASEIVSVFEELDGVIAPIYSIADIETDPHYAAREAIISVVDPILGALRMQAPSPRLDKTPARVTHTGPALGEHNDEVMVDELGLDPAEIEALIGEGAIAYAEATKSNGSRFVASQDEVVT
jgi:crotonobetainyl-CoA:carnitine CoA-transferase CaiB-like acyl-CoA transferase